jgi:protein-tyrosine phosphatase
MGIFDFFKTKPGLKENFLTLDMHSHLLPGIDDGAPTLEDSIQLVKEMQKMGFKKLITTPHIMGDFYKNTPEIIAEKLNIVKERLKTEGIDIEISAAAEYYLDEWFIEKLERKEKLLTFGDNFLLFETSFLNEPSHLKEAIFLLASQGYKPVLAHPERYVYLYSDFSKFEDLFERGAYFQINVNSLSGYYSKPARLFAEKLIQKNMVHFAGTDCHGIRHLEAFRKSMDSPFFAKLSQQNLLNSQVQ